MNQELCKLYDWLTANKLTLNVKKTNFVIFSPAQRKLTHLPKIKIFDNEQNTSVALECKEFVKYLGILIDNNLSWKHHIDHIVITVRRALPWPPNKHFLQVSQSRCANLIDRHASIKSFNTQLSNENLSILTDIVEAKAQQLYKT